MATAAGVLSGGNGSRDAAYDAGVKAVERHDCQEHLAALEKLGGRNCPEYKELDGAIRKAGTGG